MAVPLDIQEYLVEKVKEYDESFELREGSVFVDFFIKPLTIILQPIRNEIETVRFLQSLENFASMSEGDLDALLANIFVYRRSGTKSTGSVRLFFSTPRSVTVAQSAAAITALGLRFLVDQDTTITESAMSVNVDGALYFMDVAVTAEAPGDDYNISRSSIIAMEVPVAGVVRVTNLSAFTGGLATESNLEFYNRGQTAVTVRNLINDRSIPTVLLEKFPFIQSLTPIGFNDPEMGRASLEILLPGPPAHVVTIPDRGGHCDIYIEGDAFEDKSTTVQTAPQVVSTNAQRGVVTELDFGFRNISVRGGFFQGVEYPGDHLVQLLPNLKYTLYLDLDASGERHELKQLTGLLVNPYPSVPSDKIPIANLKTDGASVVEIVDIRENVFQFERPIISMDSAELLDPVSLQPTGVTLRNGETALIPSSVAVDPGSSPHFERSRGSGDLHIVLKRADGVYYQRHDSLGNVAQAAVQISSDVNARNIRCCPTYQENINVFFLDFSGNLRHLQIDNSGASLVAESTISGAGVTSEFEVHTGTFGYSNLVTINDNLGQPDLYSIRVDEAGAVDLAQTLLHSSAGNASSPDVSEAVGGRPDRLSNGSVNGITAPAGTLQDANRDFSADGVIAGDKVAIYSGGSLLTSEQGVYEVLSLATTTNPNDTINLVGAPALTASSGVDYEVIFSEGMRAVWLDDIAGNKNVQMFGFQPDTGVVTAPSSGEPVVLSDPADGLEKALPRAEFQVSSAGLPGSVFLWVSNGTEIKAARMHELSSWAVSSTGDTQGTGLSRSFLDASNPFVADDVGRFISISGGSGLTAGDFRIYKILEFISAGHVLLEEPVTDSTAADIEYAIVRLSRERDFLAHNFFYEGQVTALASAVDNSQHLHVGVIETVSNSAKVYLGKFDRFFQPLLGSVFVRVSASLNNRSSLSLGVDEVRQPYLVWGDFSASLSQVQVAKYQAQEFAYLLNKPSESLSPQEDASIILDPTLAGQAIRFNYTHSARVVEVDAYVNNTVNRVVIGNYLTRHTLPAYVDVDIEYSGDNAPDEDTAIELLTDFINSIGSQAAPPSTDEVITQTTQGDELEKSDLLDVLYDNGADSARVGSDIVVDETQQDGTVRTFRSIDRIITTRTARFIARSITVTKA